MNAIPVVMVRNEEYYIRQVLAPLAEVFGRVLLGDTGSNDRTVALARTIPGVEVVEFGELSPRNLGQVRGALGARVAALGVEWMIHVDGDELYHVETLHWLRSLAVPPGGAAGFTSLITIDPDEAGQMWELDDQFSRLAILPPLTTWHGEYPFEVPAVFDHPECFWYADVPPGFRYHGLHLHRLQRSPRDDAVFVRRQKQFQFAMQDRQVPRTVPLDMARWRLDYDG